MTGFGLDFAWSRPPITAMKSLDVTFVCRYLSHDTTGKNLTYTEAESYSKAGIDVVCVFESTATRALGGATAGIGDAILAKQQAKDCGMPAGRPIYFAVDFNAGTADLPTILAYLHGAGTVIGLGNVGVYGGYRVVSYALAHGIRWLWQTYAWSSGQWADVQIEQYSNGRSVGGADCDFNHAMKSDYGQWNHRTPVTPPLTPKDEIMGQLNTGTNAVTSEPVPDNKGYTAISLLCDNGLTGDLPPTFRVAEYSAGKWHVTQVVTVDSAKGGVRVPFTDSKTVRGFSVKRLDSPNLSVGWTVS